MTNSERRQIQTINKHRAKLVAIGDPKIGEPIINTMINLLENRWKLASKDVEETTVKSVSTNTKFFFIHSSGAEAVFCIPHRKPNLKDK